VDAAKHGTVFAEERKIAILELIDRNKKITVTELCERFNVSSATVRNDLRDLQRANLLIRTHGGAIAKTKTGFELDAEHRETQFLREKQRIAEAAANLIEDGDTIILDTGSTTLELARRLNRKRDVTVVTNDIQIAAALEDIESGQVIFMGGVLRKRFHCTIGIHGRDIFTGLLADKAFMGTNGFSIAKGAMTPDINQAETKRLMIGISSRVILLCDSSKLGRVSFAQFARVDEVNTLITDAIDKPQRKGFEGAGVEVIVAA
jgi:DeoR family fructose operon transcriptional repressor